MSNVVFKNKYHGMVPMVLKYTARCKNVGLESHSK